MSQTLLVLGMTKLNKMGPALKELSLGKIHITMITAGVKATTKTTTAFSGCSQQGQGMLRGGATLDLSVIRGVSGWIWKVRDLKCNNMDKISFTKEHDSDDSWGRRSRPGKGLKGRQRESFSRRSMMFKYKKGESLALWEHRFRPKLAGDESL